MGASQNPDEVQQPKKNRGPSAPPRQVTAPPRTVPQTPKVQRNTTGQFQSRVKPTNPNPTYIPRMSQADLQAQALARNNPTIPSQKRDYRRSTTIAKTDVTAPNQTWRRGPMPPESSDTSVQPNTNVRNRDWQNRANDRHRNWQNNNKTSGTFTYSQARQWHNRYRQHHHRDWWRSRYSRIALFAGGYYYWANNYWYPAYGYDPYYSTYAYDEPIYGYNNLDPGQVIANVQAALQEQGYYRSAVDGLIGPATRAALANFQQDQGLPITSAIDGPTLQALGLY